MQGAPKRAWDSGRSRYLLVFCLLLLGMWQSIRSIDAYEVGFLAAPVICLGALAVLFAQRRVRLGGEVGESADGILVQVLDGISPEFVLLDAATVANAPVLVRPRGDRYSVVPHPSGRYTIAVLGTGDSGGRVETGRPTEWFAALYLGHLSRRLRRA